MKPFLKYAAHGVCLLAVLKLAACRCDGCGEFVKGDVCESHDPGPLPPSPCTATTRSCNGPITDADGCETDIRNSAKDCGGCDVQCPGENAVCKDGVCGNQCGPGRKLCNDACVDLRSDPGSCGACGVVCATECHDGICAAEVVYQDSDNVPQDIVCGGGFVVFTTWDGVLALEVGKSGAPLAIAPGGFKVAGVSGGLALCGSFDQVIVAPVSGGAAIELANDVASPLQPALAIAGTDAYWVDGTALRKAPLTGGPAETVLSEGDAMALPVDTLRASEAGVFLGKLGYTLLDGPRVRSFPLGNPGAVAPFAQAAAVCWFDFQPFGKGLVALCRDTSKNELVRIDSADAAPVDVAELRVDGDLLAVSGDSVFWDDHDDLMALDLTKPGAVPEAVAHQAGGVQAACEMDGFVYFTGYDGTIRRAPRK